MQLTGKKVVITGANGGIGTAVLDRLIGYNCSVAALGRKKPAASDDLPSGSRIHWIPCDLSRPEELQQSAQAALDVLGTPDILLNMAGVQQLGQIESFTPDEILATVAVNLTAPMLLTRALLPAMKQNGDGIIVNVGSTFGSIAFAHFSTYSASKFGLRGFSEALRRELAGSGIDILYVAPRATRTRLNSDKVYEYAARSKMPVDSPEFVADRIVDAIARRKPTRYIGFPENVFVRINGLFPYLVDRALKKSDKTMREILNGT